MKPTYEELEKKLAVATKALEFYADSSTYSGIEFRCDLSVRLGGFADDFSWPHAFHPKKTPGMTARLALATIKEEEQK